MCLDEIANLRIYSLAEFAAAENSIMPHPLGQQVFAISRRNTGAQCVRRFGLAITGNVVQFAFDRKQRCFGDRLGRDKLAANTPLAFG